LSRIKNIKVGAHLSDLITPQFLLEDNEKTEYINQSLFKEQSS